MKQGGYYDMTADALVTDVRFRNRLSSPIPLHSLLLMRKRIAFSRMDCRLIEQDERGTLATKRRDSDRMTIVTIFRTEYTCSTHQ